MSNIYDDIRIAPMRDLNNVLAEFYSDCASESAAAPLHFECGDFAGEQARGPRESVFGQGHSSLEEHTNRMNWHG
jgi:hypothetical protein